jgi:hypothetical protein
MMIWFLNTYSEESLLHNFNIVLINLIDIDLMPKTNIHNDNYTNKISLNSV